MRFVFGLVLILGLGLAGSAVYLVRKQISQNEQALIEAQAQLQNQVTTADIYVAAVPLKYGHVLVPDDVRLIKFPAGSLPEGVFQEEAGLFPNGNAEKRTVLRAIEANEPILAVKVTEPGQEAGITTMLSPGMRAFTIQVDAQSGVSGFIHPGDRVDIFWSGRPSGMQEDMTRRIDTNVRVVAVDQSVDQDNRDTQIARTVTVEITAQQVANFQQAQASGRLTLALVGVGDATETQVQDVDTNSVLGIEQAAPVVVEEERKCYITVRQGTEDVQKEIRCSDQP